MKFHCLRCGSKLRKYSHREFICPKCRYTHYVNPYPTTSVIVENEKGEIMLVKRKYNPKKGYWDLPGGFVDLGESGEECSRREIKEELGINLKELIYLGSYPDKYFFQKINENTFTLWYMAKMPKEKIKVSDDISGYKFFKPKSIPYNRLAFVNLGKAIDAYLKFKKLFKKIRS